MAGIGLLDSLFAPRTGLLGMLPNPGVGSDIEPQFGSNGAFIPSPDGGADGTDPAIERALAEAAREAAAGRTRRSVIHPGSPHPMAPLPAFWGGGGNFPADGADVDPNAGIPVSPGPAGGMDPNAGIPDSPLPMGGMDPNAGVPLSMAPGEAALPPNAAPTAGMAPAAAAAPQAGPMDFMKQIAGRLFDPNKAATWLALGSGFSGAPSFGTGMRRAATAAVPAMTADRAFGQKQQTIVDTFNALRAKGVPASEALAAAQNDKIMSAVAAKYFEAKPRVPHKIGVDAMGNDIMGSFDPNTGKFYNAANQELAGGGGASGGIDAGAGMFAKGVTAIDQDLPADEYKAQFSPSVQAQIENYINGDTMPTGNPRLKGSATKIKEWAQTYGNKAGIPVSDATFSSKRTMQNQVASSSPSSMGGVLSNGKSAFGHLATLGENFVVQGQRSGPDVPGGAHVGRLANYVGNEIAPTPEARGKLTAVRDNAAKYGAEATKFYAATGGGVEERLSALKEVGQPGTLAAEQAAYLKTEKDLMLKRFAEKEDQIRAVMGDQWLEKHPVRTAALQHDIDRIDGAIKRLETGNVGDAAAPKLKPGQATTINGVTIKRLN